MEPLLKAIELRKEYTHGNSKTLAVKNISLDINRGEKIAITGPSGCGKTTLLNMIGLIIRPTSGKIIINSEDIKSLSNKNQARYRNNMFGYIVQDFSLVENYTVFENIEIPLSYSPTRISKMMRKKLISEILEEVGLSIKMEEKVANLSGGQRQRVAIARAIVNDPQIILADEPTGSLDSKTSEGILELLSNLVLKGKTLILVTHDESLAQKCDRQIRIADGTVVNR